MTRLTPVMLAALVSLTSPALAQAPGDDPREAWVVDVAPELGGGAIHEGSVGLWLPSGDRDADGNLPYVDRCYHHAAMLFRAERETHITITSFVVLADEVRYDAAQATLSAPDGTVLEVTELPLGSTFAPGLSVLEAEEGRAFVTYHLSFAALDPSWSALEVQIPSQDPHSAPLTLRLERRVERETRLAVADLEAWIGHTKQDRVREASAIVPYLNCPGYRAFREHEDRYVVALLLRELARGEAGADDALPRFLVFHVLADTDWGRARRLRSWGDAEDAGRLLQTWRDEGQPSLPGVAPE